MNWFGEASSNKGIQLLYNILFKPFPRWNLGDIYSMCIGSFSQCVGGALQISKNMISRPGIGVICTSTYYYIFRCREVGFFNNVFQAPPPPPKDSTNKPKTPSPAARAKGRSNGRSKVSDARGPSKQSPKSLTNHVIDQEDQGSNSSSDEELIVVVRRPDPSDSDSELDIPVVPPNDSVEIEDSDPPEDAEDAESATVPYDDEEALNQALERIEVDEPPDISVTLPIHRP